MDTSTSKRTVTLRDLWVFINSISTLDMGLIDAGNRQELNKLEAIIETSWKYNEAVQLRQIQGLKDDAVF